MLVAYATVLVIGLLAAAARIRACTSQAHVLRAFARGLLLIAAVPPLGDWLPDEQAARHGDDHEQCIFGAVALGPTIGGLQAQAHGWRPLLDHRRDLGDGPDPVRSGRSTTRRPPILTPRAIWPAIRAGDSRLAWPRSSGASELFSHPFLDAETIAPLLGGSGNDSSS